MGVAAGSVFARFASIPYLWIFIFGIFFVLVPLSFALVTKYVKNKNVWVLFVVPAFFYTGWLVTEVKTDTALRPLYPFMGEVHSTIYVDAPILLSHRADIGGKSISLTQLDWALHDDAGGDGLYAYRLMPCASCAGGRYTLIRL